MPGTELIDKARKDKFDKLEMDKGSDVNGHLGSLPYSTVFMKFSQLIHMSHVLKCPVGLGEKSKIKIKTCTLGF